MLISAAFAQQVGGPGEGSMFSAFLPLILIGFVFYFLLIRPQQKKQKEHRAKLAAVRRGDKVVTGGGIFGTVTKVSSDEEIQVEIAEGVRIRVATTTLMDVLTKPEPADPKADSKKDGGGQEQSGTGGGLLGRLLGGKGKAAG